MKNVSKSFEFKPYSKKELRAMYGVSKHVFNQLIRPYENEIGTIIGKYLSVKQVETIIEKLGMPKTVNIE